MKNDTELQQDVMDELEWDPSLKASGIGVSAKDGIVTLSGTVDSYSEKLAAIDATSKIFSVRGVADELQVRLPDYNKSTDEDIARSAANALAWNSNVPKDCVKAVVQNGWVTLEGEVNWQFERFAAEAAVHHQRGVLGLSNDIVVKPLVQKLDLTSKLTNAFKRDAKLDAEKIKIDARGNKITLSGSVHSYAEKDEADRAAWCMPGVAAVYNELIVR